MLIRDCDDLSRVNLLSNARIAPNKLDEKLQKGHYIGEIEFLSSVIIF
jgi:hypothetical protein